MGLTVDICSRKNQRDSLPRFPAHSARQELQGSFESQLALPEEALRFGSRESLVEGEPSLILPWRV